MPADRERFFQMTWALLHASAALLASLAAGAHVGSAIYHFRRAS